MFMLDLLYEGLIDQTSRREIGFYLKMTFFDQAQHFWDSCSYIIMKQSTIRSYRTYAIKYKCLYNFRILKNPALKRSSVAFPTVVNMLSVSLKLRHEKQDAKCILGGLKTSVWIY